MRALIAAIALIAVASPALAGVPVTLKAVPSDMDGMVTLGDIFDGAGAAGSTPVAARTGTMLSLDAAAVQMAAARAGLDWINAQGLKRIVVRGGPAPGVSEASKANVEVLTYARNISTGEMVQPEDLVWGKAAAAPSDAPRDADEVIGLVARRPLRSGAAASTRDVSAPQVVKAGEIVTVGFDQGGISLALQGRAMSGAAVGDVINVQNLTSKKIIQAIVTGPGHAAVGPAMDAMKTRSTRYASR